MQYTRVFAVFQCRYLVLMLFVYGIQITIGCVWQGEQINYQLADAKIYQSSAPDQCLVLICTSINIHSLGVNSHFVQAAEHLVTLMRTSPDSYRQW